MKLSYVIYYEGNYACDWENRAGLQVVVTVVVSLLRRETYVLRMSYIKILFFVY